MATNYISGLAGATALTLTIGGFAQTGWTPASQNGSWGAPTGGGVTATIDLVKRSNLQCAPEGFFFKVSLAGFDSVAPASEDDYDPTHHDVFYFWDFGDAGAVWDAPVNVLTHQKDANIGYGPTACHVYNSSGNYEVSVLAIEPSSGKVAEATFKIGGTGEDTPTVQDGDTVFPTDKTIVIDTTNTGLGAYPSALVYTNVTSAMSYLEGKPDPHRLIFRDGQTWNSATDKAFNSLHPSVHLTREGGGVKPIIQWTGGTRMWRFVTYDASNNKDAIIDGLDMRGGWDGTTETGNTNHSCIEHSTDQGNYLLVNNSSITDFGAHGYVAISLSNETGYRIFSNLISEGHRSYQFYEEIYAPSAYLGVRAMSNVNALSGGPRNGNHNDAAIVRFQGSKNVIMDGCDIFCRTGWFENYFGHYTQQAAIRFDQRGNAGARMNMQRCTIEGGISVNRINNTAPVNVQNNLIERCAIIGTAFDQKLLDVRYSGFTARNNFMYIPNSPRIDYYGLFNTSYFLHLEAPNDAGAQAGDVAANTAGRISFTNNTLIGLATTANGPVSGTFYNHPTIPFTTVDERNNLSHRPNEDTPVVTYAPLATSAFITARHNGYKSSYERVEFTLASSVAPAATVNVAYPSGRSAADYGTLTGESNRIGFGWKDGTNKQDCTVVFGGSDMTVTNDSGSTWSAGEAVLVLLCPNSPVHLTQYATNVPISLYRPDTGSSAIAGATGAKMVKEWFGEFRPATQSIGALEAS